jgi:L-amino acid N-acyltransferase YncA
MTGPELRVRDASEADGSTCARIYEPYVRETAVTFEIEPPGARDMAERIGTALATHAWLVLEADGRVAGYAYGGPFRSRAAYRWSAEASVYLERGLERRGGGRTLYEALFRRLSERGFRTAVAGMTLPNDASVALHRAMGFEPVGTYRAIGWKLGAWHDVAWMQRPLGPDTGPPGQLR